jgi:hypothetical protein
MYRASIGIIVAASLLLTSQYVHARGFGGAHAGGASYSGGYHAGATGGYHEGGASGHAYEGEHGTTVAHGTADAHGAAYGPGGAAAGGREVSGTAVKGPEGNVYTHDESAGRGVAAGPGGVEAGRYASSNSAIHGAGGASYAHGATGYTAAHTALPTDAGYGAATVGGGSTAYAGYHQTEAVSGNVAAARGAAVRNSYNGYGMYGAEWHTANPGAWAAAGWTGNRAWATASWPTIGTTLGWGAAVQPVAYDYGTDIVYQGDQVYYGSQSVCTADQYYQQACTLAQSVPPPDQNSSQWTPLGVFALVQKDQSDPHYVMQLAVNQSGCIAGNYSDMVSGTTLPVHGSVDKKTQRVAWTVGNNKNTVGETGLYNLTKDESPALIHIGKDKTQQWTLVRLKQPEAESQR